MKTLWVRVRRTCPGGIPCKSPACWNKRYMLKYTTAPVTRECPHGGNSQAPDGHPNVGKHQWYLLINPCTPLPSRSSGRGQRCIEKTCLLWCFCIYRWQLRGPWNYVCWSMFLLLFQKRLSDEWRMKESLGILCLGSSPLAPDPQEGLSFGFKMSANVTWRQAASTQQTGKPKPQTALVGGLLPGQASAQMIGGDGSSGRRKRSTRSRWLNQPLGQVRMAYVIR